MTLRPLKRALLSLSDKTNLKELCTFLHSIHCEMVGTSSTCKAILDLGFSCLPAETLTNFPEMLGGRVKTLHPNIFGAILGRPQNKQDEKDFAQFNIQPFDLVVCNLYPFQKALEEMDPAVSPMGSPRDDKIISPMGSPRDDKIISPMGSPRDDKIISPMGSPRDDKIISPMGSPRDDKIISPMGSPRDDKIISPMGSPRDDAVVSKLVENIDIGGVSLLRAAAKNYATVSILCDASDYLPFISCLQNNNNLCSLDVRQELAVKALKETASYDELISSSLASCFESKNKPLFSHLGPVRQKNTNDINHFPNSLSLNLTKIQSLRYGENPHQKASFYQLSDVNHSEFCSLVNLNCFHGKELSYNNMLDIEHAVRLAKEFTNTTSFAAIIVKHNTPCGVGLSMVSIHDAYKKAFEADPVSPFGGIVCLSTSVTQECAMALAETFLEVIIAPEFNSDALEILQKKKNLRLVTLNLSAPLANDVIFTHVQGGILAQSANNSILNLNNVTYPTIRKPQQSILNAMQFAMTVVKHVRSNAIVVTNQNQTISIAGGFTNRVDAVQLALQKVKLPITEAVLASDAFFPFADSIELIQNSGIQYIIQPGGSVQDAKVIEACDKYNLCMVFTGTRHFKH